MSIGPARVAIRGLTVAFGQVAVVSDLSVEVGAAETVVLLGPSGCGKSTVLRTVAGLLPPTSGGIEVDGMPISGTSPDRALVFQEDALLPWRTALGNVELALSIRGVPRRRRRDEALALLAEVGLSGFERHLPRQLSGGMRQRVQLARSLAARPRVMLMDEPFGALDGRTRASMQRLLVEIRNQHDMTVILVTHDIDEALRLGDRIVVLSSRPARIVTIVERCTEGGEWASDGAGAEARSRLLSVLDDADLMEAGQRR